MTRFILGFAAGALLARALTDQTLALVGLVAIGLVGLLLFLLHLGIRDFQGY